MNAFTLSAAATPTPDILVTASALSNDGIVNVPLAGARLFTAAAMNVGVAGTVTASVDDGGRNLPLAITLCRTETGACTAPLAASSRFALAAGAVATLQVFVESFGPVALNPGVNRLHIRLRTDDGVLRGSTSVPVRTQ